MVDYKKSGKSMKLLIDANVFRVFQELLAKREVTSVVEFADKLGVTHANNLHSIFRAAKGEKTSVRHVNEPLIIALRNEFNVNEMFLRYGQLPMFLPQINKAESKKKYTSSLEAIRDFYELSPKVWAEILDIPATNIDNLIKEEQSNKGLPLNVIKSLHHKLRIPYEFIIDFAGDIEPLVMMRKNDIGLSRITKPLSRINPKSKAKAKVKKKKK